MNREQILQEFQKIKLAFKRTDENFRNVDVHVGEHLRRMLKSDKTVDELYLNAMTRDRMWTALMELLVAKGIFTKAEYDAELDLLNKAVEKAVEESAKKKAEPSATPSAPTREPHGDPLVVPPEAALVS